MTTRLFLFLLLLQLPSAQAEGQQNPSERTGTEAGFVMPAGRKEQNGGETAFPTQAGAPDDQRVDGPETGWQRQLFYGALTGLAIAIFFTLVLLKNNRHGQQANTLLLQQKEKLETTLTELRATQFQSAEREKITSFRELTSGVAHEIQNPLNFVNNFSEVNEELIEELKEKIQKSCLTQEEKDALQDIAVELVQNQHKITQHGKRADAVVKAMLQRSRTTAGNNEPSPINTLMNEYMQANRKAMEPKEKTV